MGKSGVYRVVHYFFFLFFKHTNCGAPTNKYSKIPILRPPLRLSKSGLKDHFWTVPKVISNERGTGRRK